MNRPNFLHEMTLAEVEDEFEANTRKWKEARDSVRQAELHEQQMAERDRILRRELIARYKAEKDEAKPE